MKKEGELLARISVCLSPPLEQTGENWFASRQGRTAIPPAHECLWKPRLAPGSVTFRVPGSEQREQTKRCHPLEAGEEASSDGKTCSFCGEQETSGGHGRES